MGGRHDYCGVPFLEDLNKRQERIRFTAEISTQSCNFLDLTIYNSPRFLSTGILSTKIYYKPTNTFSFPLGTSCMPKNIHKSIAIGEMTRLLRNTESPTIFRHYKNKLIKKFARRKYPKSILRILKQMTHKSRMQILYGNKKRWGMERPLPFVTEYAKYSSHLNKIFRNRWRNIYDVPMFHTLLPNTPFTAFKNSKTIKRLLSAKRRKFHTEKTGYTPMMCEGGDLKFTKFHNHKI